MVGTSVLASLGVPPAAAQIPVVVDLRDEPPAADPGPGAGPPPEPEPSPATPGAPVPPGSEAPLPAPEPDDGVPEVPASTPTVAVPPAPDPSPLPRTGADAGLLLVLAVLCVVLGASLLRILASRRTR